MGTFPTHNLILTKYPPIYRSGEKVTGQLLVETSVETVKVFAVRLSLRGKAVTYYKAGKGRAEETEVLVNETKNHFRSGKGQKFLPIGKYTYPFTFTLPVYLPSTMEFDWGHTKYYLEVELALKMTSKACCITTPSIALPGLQSRRYTISVYSKVNLKNRLISNEPGMVSREKNFNIFRVGVAGYHFKLLKRGYLPGEVIQFHTLLYNLSSRKVYTVLKLVQTIVFGSSSETMSKEKEVLKEIRLPTLEPDETTECNWDDEGLRSHRLEIPETTFVSNSCEIINVVTFLKIEMRAEYGPFTKKLNDRIYILLGTIQ